MLFSRRHFVRGAAAALAVAPFVRTLPVGAQPAVRPAPGLPAPRFITTNGIRMAVYEAGEGLPVVFVHGFPELAFSWRNQFRSYPAAGLRAIAPDMRGYGLTDRPPDVTGYAISNLCADLLGLLDALDIERAVFCGHDWGGVPVWTMPRIHPDRVAGVIGVNTPAFGGNQGAGQSGQPAEEPLIIPTENYYSATFLEPGRAEAVFERDVRRALEMVFRRGWYWDVENMRRYPPDSAEKTMDWLRMIEEGNYQGELVLSPEALDYWVETFEATGFTGGLNYYRANMANGGAAMFQHTWRHRGAVPLRRRRERHDPASLRRRRHVGVHRGPGAARDRRLRPLDAAGAAGGVRPGDPRLDPQEVPRRLNAAEQPVPRPATGRCCWPLRSAATGTPPGTAGSRSGSRSSSTAAVPAAGPSPARTARRTARCPARC